MNEDESLLHIHFGGGALGLGLIIPLIRSIPHRRLIVFNRKSSNSRHRALENKQRYTLVNGHDVLQFVDGFDYVVATDWAQIEDMFVNNQKIIITTAVGEGNLPEVAKAMAYGLSVRDMNKGYVVVLPCENINDNARVFRGLVEEELVKLGRDIAIAAKAEYIHTIPDRICALSESIGEDIVVSAEPDAKLYVSFENPNCSAIKDISALPLVEDIPFEQLPVFEMRKRWCMNGLHLAAAARAFNRKIRILRESVEDPFEWNRLKRLSIELSIALNLHGKYHGREDSLRDNIAYCTGALERFRRNRFDRSERILRNLLAFSGSIASATEVSAEGGGSAKHVGINCIEMYSFLSKVNERLGAPARILMDRYKELHDLLPHSTIEIGLATWDVLDAIRGVFRDLHSAAGK